MSRIEIKEKGRKDTDSRGWLQSRDGHSYWVSGYNAALQSEIDENKKKTTERSCFSACQTCGHCKNSRRNCARPYNFDRGNKKFCEGCEAFGFCDCANGKLRNARGNAEPFTEEAQKLFDQGGKPLI